MSSTSVPPPDDRAPDGAGAAPTAADPASDGAVVSPAVAGGPEATPAAEEQAGEEQAAERQAGEEQAAEGQAGEEQAAEGQAGEEQAGEEQAGEEQAAEGQAGEARRVADVVDPTTVRQAPRIGRFILLGAVLGIALAAVLALATPASELDRSDLFWFLLLGLAPVGALTGAVVALVLDRRSLRAQSARGAGQGARP
ncbi:hypothetical protein [Georgenia muralis]|uniref:Uncharacterized protein n=1 Tax=Georgenia muralis TaxID=154117 RepID=A0A3N4Z1X6_9MICO|nr:hypothetical protein [Georgenia muralis]RPF27259.1 hypothetical protein EDD32_1730 [Georgenia muralis]